MNWGRAKTILIILFLVTDIFLSYILVQTKMGTTRISNETILTTVQVLEKNGLTVSKDIIPNRRPDNQNVVMRNIFDDTQEIADILLGEYEVTKQDDGQHIYQYTSSRAELRSSDEGFIFTLLKSPVPYVKEKEPTPEDMQTKVLDQLAKLGFAKKEIFVDKGHMEEGLYRSFAVPLYRGMKIYGVSMEIVADSEGVVSLSGNWFKPEKTESYEKEQLLDITAVLTGLIYREDCKNMKISVIESAYHVSGDYLNSRELVAVPVYIIQDEKGNKVYFDARMGNMIAE
ncbi:MAG: hypothetical protein IKW06_03415 [Clostridia bacterium]|nr:hypothetical protein [Clostridia bacterium]